MTNFRVIVVIIIIASIATIPFLGHYLYDWDELNFAEAAREMIITGDYASVRIDYETFHEKPPFYFWLQAASMQLFGINEFSARLPNALINIITLLYVFLIGTKIFDRQTAIWWVIFYASSFLPRFYFGFAIIDPTFNLLIFASIYYLFKSLNNENSKLNIDLIIAAFMMGLAIMTKGPVAYLLVFLTMAIYSIKQTARPKLLHFVVFTTIAALPYIIWYLIIASKNGIGSNLLFSFIEYQLRLFATKDAGHGGFFLYHPVIILIGCFPASLIALKGFRFNWHGQNNAEAFIRLCSWLVIVVVIVFSIVETKIVHYSSLAYLPLTLLASYYVTQINKIGKNLPLIITILIGIIGLLYSLFLIFLPLVLKNPDSILSAVKDQLTREVLQARIYWNGNEELIGIILLLFLIAGLILLFKNKLEKGLLILCAGTFFCFSLFLNVFNPKIVQYTQGASIEFYKSKTNCGCYIEPLGFKTYSHYFYSRRKIEQSYTSKNMNSEDFRNYLLNGKIDKEAYFIVKTIHLREYEGIPNLQLLYKKNGFAFLMRKP